MARHWLLTITCYGTWLPGDDRGFIGNVWDHRPDDPADKSRVRHNVLGTECDEALPLLRAASAELLKGPPIYLTLPQAEELLAQFRETAAHRRWALLAVAVMYNHFHIVVGVPGNPDPGKVLGDFKGWGTRKLSTLFGEPPAETWWTEGGSKRKKDTPRKLTDAIHYVLYRQPNPLVTWKPYEHVF